MPATTRRTDGCPLCGSARVICTHETPSVTLWRCQRCSLQWPTLDTEPIADEGAHVHQRDRPRDQSS